LSLTRTSFTREGKGKEHTVNSPMRTICPTSLLLCLVNLNVRDVERVYIKAFHLQPEVCHRTTFIKQSYKEQYAHKLMQINKENEDYTKKYSEKQINTVSTSALLSAFFNKPSKKVADFTGQRPCPLEWRALACAVRPTPPQNRRKGMACLWASTSSKYLLAFVNSRCLIACAASLVFYFTQGSQHQQQCMWQPLVTEEIFGSYAWTEIIHVHITQVLSQLTIENPLRRM
jgi:hypothetical protein